VLTSLGGIAGIIFGWIISVVSRLVFTSLPATVPLWAAALGIIVSVGVGLFFGICLRTRLRCSIRSRHCATNEWNTWAMSFVV